MQRPWGRIMPSMFKGSKEVEVSWWEWGGGDPAAYRRELSGREGEGPG